MPKRIIDGDAMWRSDKIAAIEEDWMRAEFAWLLANALANGSFECNPRLIWSRCYAYTRPEITVEKVSAILDELERVKLLFRWTDASGKLWGFWVGINGPGRLPSGSRLKKGHDSVGAEPPTGDLARFLGKETNGQPVASHGLANGQVGFGSGSGLGSGFGSGSARDECPEEQIDASMIARGVTELTGLTGLQVLESIQAQAQVQLRSGAEASAIRDEMVRAWKYFQAHRGKLEIAWGAPKFFSEGHWRNSDAWPWKEGSQPRTESRGSDLDPMAAALLASERGNKLREENEARKLRFEVAGAVGGSQ